MPHLPPSSQRFSRPSAFPSPFALASPFQRHPLSSSSHSAGGASRFEDDVDREMRELLDAADDEGEGEGEGGASGEGAWEAMDVDGAGEMGYGLFGASSSPSPSGHFIHPSQLAPPLSQQQQSQQERYSRTLSYYAQPPPAQPQFGSFASTSTSRPTSHAPPPLQQRSLGESRSAVPSLIRPMPVRPAQSSLSQTVTHQIVRPSATYPAAPPSQTQHASRVSVGRQGNGKGKGKGKRAMQLDAPDEDEEQYWGGQGDEGWEEALVGLTEGVVNSGPAASGSGSRSFPRPSVSQSVYPAPRASQRPQGHAPSAQHQQQQQQQVAYLEDVDPFSAGVGARGAAGATVARKRAEGGVPEVRRQGIKLRPVSELPDMFRSLWRFGVFNAVQSSCFDSVYHSNQNVVVSAPTGAGKTVLFELAILRLFTTTTSTETKVLYMAPTKSLCSERVVDWKRKFEHGLGWAVQELTGDSDTSTNAWRDVAEAKIVVTTPEKWDAMTRKWLDHGTTLGQFGLFCVDEVHTVGADVRGAVLEVVVSRMKTLGTSTRFIAVSATVPNIEDVAEWLGPGPDEEEDAAASTPRDGGRRKSAQVFKFGDEFRPCKLQKLVFGYPKGGNDFAFANTLSFKLYDLIKQYSSGKPVLVFCSTRKGCSQAADALVKEYKNVLASAAGARNLAWPRPPRSEYKTSDKHLATLIESGVAVHHAGMELNDRRLVEKLFVEGGVSVVCSTSTLAVGVNLPARMVIIKGTKGFADGQTKEYSELEVQQMIGRAGRPQFDTMGIAVIMTDRDSQHRYENLVNSQNKLESCLHKSLTEHVNSEITLQTITDVPSALHWLRSTFLFIRIAKNAPYYAIANGASNPDERLEEICVQAIKELVDSGIVDQVEETLAPNQYGDIMAKLYLSHTTFLKFKDLPLKSNMRTLLETLSSAHEFSSFRFRQGEKSVLAKYNKNLRFPTEKVATTADRVMILIQLVLEGVPGSELKSDSINPLLDARAIFSAALRITKGMVDVAVQREDGAVRAMLELLRSLNGRCWDGSSFVLRQLEGIGEKSYKALVDSGIKGFEDVMQAEPERLEIILSRKPPYGRKLISLAKSLPQFEVEIESSSETVLPEGVQVDATVTLSVKQTKPPAATKKGPIKLWATVLSVTSDGEFVDFRRARLDQLVATPKQFDLSVVLVKPSQRIFVSVSCDLIAGTEVKAVFKPETRASSFPIPSLGPSGSEQDEEEAPQPLKKKIVAARKPTVDAPKVKANGAATTAATEEDDDDPYEEPRMRPDGKFECKHTCGDKTSCRHSCCRDGLDRPSRRKSKAVGAPKAVKKPKALTTLDQAFPAVPKDAQNKPLRLPGKPTSTVSLSRQSGGKTTTAEVGGDDADEPTLPSLDALFQKNKHNSLRRTLSASNRMPPTPVKSAYLDLDDSDSGDDLLGGHFPSPSPPKPRATQSIRKAKRSVPSDENEPASQRFGKKQRRASLREFASSSSSSDVEADKPASSDTVKTPAQVESLQDRSEDRLFRNPSPVTSSPFSLFPRAADVSILSPFASPSPEPVQPREGTPLPIAEEEVDELEGGVADESVLAVEEADTLEPDKAADADDDDDFDAWLATNVTVV
ncbi:hypothetical protein JCM10207_007458 [Rhodosporidiobolus poonsookiae]